MDQLPPLGRAIFEVAGPTSQIYGGILKSNSASAINSTSRETFAYGPDPRQQLDVYKPSSSAPQPPPGTARPILVFLYGGGFVQGDKVLHMMPEGLAYKNIGYFFAEKLGFETIIIDYRLIPHGAKFPSGGEDVSLALQWIEKRNAGSSSPIPREVFVMGNSAGGVHLATYLFSDRFRDTKDRILSGQSSGQITLSRVIFLGTPFHFKDSAPPLMEILNQYYGDPWAEDVPLALAQSALETAKDKKNNYWPKMLVLDSELDPEEISAAAKDFVSTMKDVPGFDLTYMNLKGHNHISPSLSLGTGIEKEEEWGYAVGKWCSRSNSSGTFRI